MQVETEAPAGLPEGEAALNPADDSAPTTGQEQNPQTDEQDQPKDESAKPEGEQKAGEEEAQPKRTPWFQRRIDDLTREKWEARREAESWKALATLGKGTQQPEGQAAQQPAPSPEDIRRMAAEIAATERFNDSCNEIYDRGVKEFPDFTETLTQFQRLGGLPRELVEAAQEAGDAHRILHQLGKNPDEAARILSLSPIRMAAAVAKLASNAPAPRPVSSAPKPIKPLAERGTVETDPDKMPMAEWEKRHPLPSR